MSKPSRRKAREAALQLLYQVDLTGDDGDAAFAAYWSSWPDAEPDPRTREFAETLVRFVLADEVRIDAAIDAAARDRKSTRLNSSHLKLSRMPSSA